MKESFWGIFVVALGIIGIAVVNSFQTITTTNEQNYYLLKEVTEASMVDAFDLAKYRQTGEVRIYKEKFVESFLERWSESADRVRTYTVEIYDINESPPKVSIKVTSQSETFMFNMSGKTTDSKDESSFNIVGSIDAILETKY